MQSVATARTVENSSAVHGGVTIEDASNSTDRDWREDCCDEDEDIANCSHPVTAADVIGQKLLLLLLLFYI